MHCGSLFASFSQHNVPYLHLPPVGTRRGQWSSSLCWGVFAGSLKPCPAAVGWGERYSMSPIPWHRISACTTSRAHTGTPPAHHPQGSFPPVPLPPGPHLPGESTDPCWGILVPTQRLDRSHQGEPRSTHGCSCIQLAMAERAVVCPGEAALNLEESSSLCQSSRTCAGTRIINIGELSQLTALQAMCCS